MIPKIFDIDNGKVVINPECLLIPELKAVVDNYTDPLPALSFLYFLHHPEGPYSNIPEDEKEDIIFQDFPGDYSLEEEVMHKASEKLASLYMTPTFRYYLDQKVLLEKLRKFARSTAITGGKDGNLNSFLAQLRSTSKTINEFKLLENMVNKELHSETKIRGNKKKAYDL